MIKSLLVLSIIVLPGLLIAQKQKALEPIDNVGWELPDLSDLDSFNQESDAGSVTYLLLISRAGRIKKIKVLSNTFSVASELRLRNLLKDLTLKKKEKEKGQLGYRGTLEISMSRCIDNRENKL